MSKISFYSRERFTKKAVKNNYKLQIFTFIKSVYSFNILPFASLSHSPKAYKVLYNFFYQNGKVLCTI